MLDKDFTADGLVPEGVRRSVPMKVTAKFRHAFLFRKPVMLPRGTIIRGVRAPARITLLPAGS